MSAAKHRKGRVTARGSPRRTAGRGLRLVPAVAIFILSTLTSMILMGGGGTQFESMAAYAETVPVVRNDEQPPEESLTMTASQSTLDDSMYRVQAVLSAKRRAVVASAIDGRITAFNVDNGDLFVKGDTLVEYDCTIDQARLKEAVARQTATGVQLAAYKRLKELDSASEIEYQTAKAANDQNKAMVEQIRGRLKFCKIVAPFDGRVTNKMANQYEFVQTGRVMLDISSREPLRAEFLIPSDWLRWLNLGTPVTIHVNEPGRDYEASIVAVHGEVDPVSRSVQVVAEMEDYHEELLPGMSGQAVFAPQTVKDGVKRGFLGIVLQDNDMIDHDQE